MLLTTLHTWLATTLSVFETTACYERKVERERGNLGLPLPMGVLNVRCFQLHSIVTMSPSCTVSEFYRVLPIWTYPTCIWRPRRGWLRGNFAEIFWHRQTRVHVHGISYGAVCMILFWYSAAGASLWQTDIRTDIWRQHIGLPSWHNIAR